MKQEKATLANFTPDSNNNNNNLDYPIQRTNLRINLFIINNKNNNNAIP